MNIKKGLTIILALAMLFTITSTAAAGRRGWGDGDCGPDFQRGPGGRHGGHGMMGLGFLRAAGLTDDQKRQVAAVLKGYMPDMKAQTAAMHEARQAMIEAMTADDATEEAVREAHRKAAAAGEALAVIRFNVASDVKKLLTDEQIATLKAKKARRTERMAERYERRWAEFEKQVEELTQ